MVVFWLYLFIFSANVKGHAPASEGELPPLSETSPNPPDPNTEREAGCCVPSCCASSFPVWTFELIDEDDNTLTQYHVNAKTLKPYVIQSCLNKMVDDILGQSLSLAGKAFRVRANKLNHVLEGE